jgi:hypothetical protein
LYFDNELTADQKREVDEFLVREHSLQKEFEQFRQSKLIPEPVIFAGKSGLYRKEERPVRRIAPVWWRVAAAVLLIAIGLTTIIVLNKKPSGSGPGEVAVIPATEQKTVPVQPSESKDETIPVVTGRESDNVAVTAPGQKQEKTVRQTNLADNNKPAQLQNRVPEKIMPPVSNEKQAIAGNNNENKFSNNLPQPLPERINTSERAIAKNDIPDEIKNPNKTSLTNDPVTTNTTQPSYVVNTSGDTDAEFNQESGKKNKLRGFFRKVTRTFEKRTNIDATDNDRLLVGGLAIKLK